MRFVVTGAAGFIGSTVCERLLARGHEVAGVDCFTDYYPRRLKELNLQAARDHRAFALHRADLVELDLEPLVQEADAVIHLAAQAGVRRSWGAEFAHYTHNNITATQRLLEAAKAAPGLGRVVYASSSSVYGDAQVLPMQEDAACWPVSPYGVSKLAAEHLCSLYHRNFGVPAVSLRYFTVYGPRQRPDMAFHRFIRAMLTGGEIRLFGDGEQSRDFTFVADIAEATIAAATAPEAAGRVLNLGGGHRATVNQVLDRLAEITGGRATVRREAVAKGDVRDTSADTGRAARVLGFAPAYDLDRGLAEEAAWVQEMLPVLESAA
jgi:UDP-glucose 4-epimerase